MCARPNCISSVVSDLLSFFVSAESSGLIAVDSDHLCPDGGVEAAWCVSLSANQGVTTPFCKGLKEVGNNTQVALTLVLDLSLSLTH